MAIVCVFSSGGKEARPVNTDEAHDEQEHIIDSDAWRYERKLSACLVRSTRLGMVLPADGGDGRRKYLEYMQAWRHLHADLENQPCWSARGVVRGQEPQRL